MSSSSSAALLFSLTVLGVYAYSVYYMVYDPNLKEMHKFLPASLRPYGQLKFLTFHCLCIQVLNLILHVGAHFVSSLRKPRDILFTALAYPIGCIVVFTFWGVWHILGRELIFPAKLSEFYPDWLNHVTHTIIVPVNFILTMLVHHDYGRNRFLVLVAYFGCYTLLLEYIKLQTGHFVYAYLETMNQPIRALYFLSTAGIAYFVLKSGQMLDSVFHSKSASQRPAVKKAKQK